MGITVTDDRLRTGQPEESHVDDFFRFVFERQAIWHRRYVLNSPPPWTEDSVLRNYRFTNVQRELDRGTRFLLTNIVERRDATDLARFWNMLVYRLWNKVETWDRYIGWVEPEEWGERSFEIFCELGEAKRKGISLATGAHQSLQLNKASGDTTLQKYYYLTKDEWLPRLQELWPELEQASSLNQVTNLLMALPGISTFRGYQLSLDYRYLRPDLSEDEWALPGPGAKAGLNILFPSRQQPALDAIREIRDIQDTRLRALDLRWSTVAWPRKPRLTLADVEHSLCEFSKYWAMKHSGVHGRRFMPELR